MSGRDALDDATELADRTFEPAPAGHGYGVGDWVEVLSKEEILATLDAEGCLDGMPFMPEMFAWCGRRMQVFKSAHKTCDTVFPIRGRRLDDAVHLEARCDGSAHGGCQAGCLLFWKTAWLRPAQPPETQAAVVTSPVQASKRVPVAAAKCREADVTRAAQRDGDDPGDPVYVCQATRLPYFTRDLSPYDPRQYLRDLSSGNVGFGAWLSGVIYIAYYRVMNLGIGVGAPMRWLYDRFQRLIGGVPFPRRFGRIPVGEPTPGGELGLREGEWVRVKSYEEILATCNVENRNRGLYFDAEQVPYCGGTYRVHRRVTTIINENTGRLMHMKSPCIVLEGVYCRSRYSDCRMFCPRAIYSYWRENWLERVPAPGE